MKIEKPLMGGSSEGAIQNNIRELIASGYSPEQATAIAYARAGKGRDKAKKAMQHSGIMIAMYLPIQIADVLAIEGGEAPSDLHVTLGYIPDAGDDPEVRKKVEDVVYQVACMFNSPVAWIGGHGVFSGSPTSDGMDVYWASFNCPALTAIRNEMIRLLDLIGIDLSMKHGYTPHVTLKYMRGEMLPAETPKTDPFSVRAMSVVAGDEETRFLFSGTRLTKALVPSPSCFIVGPERPRAVFVLTDKETPTMEERLRAMPLVNEDTAIFEKRYLEPLGLDRDEVALAWAHVGDGADALAEYIVKLALDVPVIWLGQQIAFSTKREHATLPRFIRDGELWKSSFKEELDRKLRRLRKQLDRRADLNALSIHPLLKAARPHDGAGQNATQARIFKALAAKRIVYSVVLDPYQVDLQGDWIPPADIEDTAHRYVLNDGYVSDRHEEVAKGSHFVESSVEGYPPGEREKAFAGLPHRAYRRKFGDDWVHSGAWILGIQLEPALWEEFEKGELQAFSIEGFGTRTEISSEEMPQVTFVDLETIG